MASAKIVLPNYHKLVLYTDQDKQITSEEGVLLPSSFGSYTTFEILNTHDGKFKLRTNELEAGYVSCNERGLYLGSSFVDADQFEVHLNTTNDTFTLLSTSRNVKSTGRPVYVSLNPPIKI